MSQTTTQQADAAQPPLSQDLVVKCIGLSKTFKDFWMRNRVKAVNNIDLEIRKGEVFGLLGPNGSGKSTTIKLILGLLHPTGGRIAVFGRHPRDVKNKQRIGYLPEESYLYPFLNAYETLEYYARLFHQKRGIRKGRIDTLLEMVGLQHVARRPIGEYSKGMQRKIGLAQALINDPDLLILDEPTAGMDPIATADVKRVILSLAERGKTILLCSHLLSDVEDVTDRVAIMYGGKVRRHGQIDELLEQHDRTLISIPVLDTQAEEGVIKTLESQGICDTAISRPRQKLETLFLNIVAEAQAAGAATSGAQSGGKIADFLATGEDVEGGAVIDDLIAKSTHTDSPDPSTLQEVEPDDTARHDTGLIGSLTGDDAQTPQANDVLDRNEPSPEPQPQADTSLIDSLIQKKDDQDPPKA
jgi:ABC-2 type transport system ATP-binding protein